MKRKIKQMYEAVVPMLHKVDRNNFFVDIIESKENSGVCIATFYFSYYYEDSGDYVKNVDLILSVRCVRELKVAFKNWYLSEDLNENH